jgi:hypothetical protein
MTDRERARFNIERLRANSKCGCTQRTVRYSNVIKSVRLSVDALAFNGSFVAFALF